MSPWYRMARDGDAAAHAAVLEDLRETLRGLACALRLLGRRPGPSSERAILAAMRGTLRRAESALDRIPGRPIKRAD